MTREEYAAKLEKAHEALLNTIGASASPWLKKVWWNAAKYYEKLQKEEKGE